MSKPAYKRCTTCGETKDIDQFHRQRAGKYGRASRCKPCTSAYKKRWKAANRERISVQEKEYRTRTREQRKKYEAEYYAKNRDRLAAVHKRYHETYTPDPVKARAHENAKNARRRAAKRNAPFEYFHHAEIFERDQGICGICSLPVDPAHWHLDHARPLSRGGSHTRDNVQVSHPGCNVRKGARL